MRSLLLLLRHTVLSGFWWSLAAAQGASNTTCKALPLPSKTIYQFNKTDQWIENVMARRNGDLIVTLAGPKAQMYLVKNPAGNTTIKLLHDFDAEIVARLAASNATAKPTNTTSVLLGVAEPKPDVFITAGGLLTSDRDSIPNTWGVFELAFLNQTDEVAVRKVADLPGAEFPNGVVSLDYGNISALVTPTGGVVLIGDSTRGLIYRVDTSLGSVDVAVKGVPEMQPRANGDPPFGINGMKMRNGTLFFDNSNDRAFYSVAIASDGRSLAPNAAVKKIGSAADASVFVDDFDVEADGTIWASGSFGNTLLAIDPKTQKATVVAGSAKSLAVGGPTSVAFGRGNDTALYVVTAGAQGDPINGTAMEPGKIMRFNISGYAQCKTVQPQMSLMSIMTGLGPNGTSGSLAAPRAVAGSGLVSVLVGLVVMAWIL